MVNISRFRRGIEELDRRLQEPSPPELELPERCPKCVSTHIEVTTIGFLAGPDPNERRCLTCKHRWYHPDYAKERADG